MSNAPNSRQMEAFADIMEDEDTGVSGPSGPPRGRE